MRKTVDEDFETLDRVFAEWTALSPARRLSPPALGRLAGVTRRTISTPEQPFRDWEIYAAVAHMLHERGYERESAGVSRLVDVLKRRDGASSSTEAPKNA